MWPFKNKKLDDLIYETTAFKIKGIVFKIKKIDPLSYIDGSNALQKVYDIYSKEESGLINSSLTATELRKLKDHYRDVFCASLVLPKVVRKEGEAGFFIDDIFLDWDLCNILYEKIMIFTYGKKKILSKKFLGKNF